MSNQQTQTTAKVCNHKPGDNWEDECCGKEQLTNQDSGMVSNKVNQQQIFAEQPYELSTQKTQTIAKVCNHKPGDNWEDDCCKEG